MVSPYEIIETINRIYKPIIYLAGLFLIEVSIS